MLVSSTSINAASETAMAIIQGLPLGCQISSPALAVVAELIAPSHVPERCTTKAKALRSQYVAEITDLT
jgi:hypothetical protein